MALSVLAGTLCISLHAQVQKSRAAGRWYPGQKVELQKALDEVFARAAERAGNAPIRKNLRALIVPHAAIQFSGVVAASGYRLVGKPQNVILLVFSHATRVDGVVAPGLDGYSTPLGEVRLNRAVLDELAFPTLEGDPIADHSLENQLPFIQHVTPRAKIVPLYVGELTGEQLDRAAAKLAGRLRKGDLLVVSSDLTHYGKDYGYTPFPNDENLPGRLYQLAMTAIDEIGSLDVSGFDAHLADTRDTICGQFPIRLLMAALSRIEEPAYLQLADYMTSGDLIRDHSMSVGYGALAFYPSSAFQVSAGDQTKLLASARKTLDRYLAEGSKSGVLVPEEDRGPDLRQRTGVFVTVRKSGELRGCVGAISPRRPLGDLVADRTLAAASSDPRFKPLTADEGPVTLEISVLTPAKKIRDWRQFRLGFGVVLVHGDKGGTLLPQIAQEYGWNAQQFLENLCRKAGLEPTAYRDPEASLYVYEAQVFAESEPAIAVDGVPTQEKPASGPAPRQ